MHNRTDRRITPALVIFVICIFMAGCSPIAPNFVLKVTETQQIPTSIRSTVTPKALITGVPTVFATPDPTSAPTVIATATVIPTDIMQACEDDKNLIYMLTQKSLEIYRNGPDNVTYMSRLFRFQTLHSGAGQIWQGWAISTGKTEDRLVDVNGQKYTLHILKVLMVGSDDKSGLMEVKVVFAITNPGGQYLYRMPVKAGYGTPEHAQKFLTPFGTVLSIYTEKEKNDSRDWDLCIKGGSEGMNKPDTIETCRVAKELSVNQSDDGKIFNGMANGVQPASDWIWMGATIFRPSESRDVDVTIDMPACKP